MTSQVSRKGAGLRDPQFLHQVFEGFAMAIAKPVDGRHKPLKLSNYLSGENLALSAILTAMRKKSGISVSPTKSWSGSRLRCRLRPRNMARESPTLYAMESTASS